MIFVLKSPFMKKIMIPFVIIISALSQLNATPLSDELFVLHNVTTAEMNAIVSPQQGSLIFNTDDNLVYERNASAWNSTTGNGSNTKIIAGNGIKVIGSGTNTDPYQVSIETSYDCTSGAQSFSSCKAVNLNVDGAYCIDHDGAGGDAPYMVYCDMTTDSGGWHRVVRTTGNSQQFGQKNDSITYAAVTEPAGIYATYDKVKNFTKVMIKKVGTADYASYDLVSAVAGESIHDLMTFVKNQAMHISDDTAFDGTRVKGLTSEYSGTKVAGTLNYNYFFMAGINESSDNDQAYMSFSDSTGSNNTWADRWRRTDQAGTIWSLLNGDYYATSNFHIGNGYSQAGAGYKGNNNGTYEIYIK
jgi:hypothetical protein